MHLQDDHERGLYAKFHVSRVDGSDAEGGRHHGCRYFTLDPQHDPGARFALRAYKVWASLNGFNKLAEDLSAWLGELRAKGLG